MIDNPGTQDDNSRSLEYWKCRVQYITDKLDEMRHDRNQWMWKAQDLMAKYEPVPRRPLVHTTNIVDEQGRTEYPDATDTNDRDYNG